VQNDQHHEPPLGSTGLFAEQRFVFVLALARIFHSAICFWGRVRQRIEKMSSRRRLKALESGLALPRPRIRIFYRF
jgi:hypothetical protein